MLHKLPFTSLALCLALLLAAPSPVSAQETIPPGTPLESGLSIDLTEEGLNTLLGVLSEILPPELLIESIGAQELYAIPFLCDPQMFTLQNIIVHTQVNGITAAAFAPGTDAAYPDGALTVSINLDLWINDPADPAQMIIFGDDFACLDYVCDVYTEPSVVTMDLPMTFSIGVNEAGDPAILLDMGEVTHNLDSALNGNVHVTGCAIGEINEILAQVGLNLIDFIIQQFVGDLTSTLDQTFADLETTVADSSPAAWLSDTLPVLDAELSYDIHPTAIVHDDDGLRLVMGGSFDADPHRCIAQYADKGSRFTDSPLPDFHTEVPGTTDLFHAVGIVADDFINQALYAAWRGGAMCLVIDENLFAMDTSYLSLLLGQEYTDRLAELFPDGDVPMLVRTVPAVPPVARFDGDDPITIEAPRFGIEFYPLMYGRFTRLAAVSIDITAGINAYIDATDALALDITIDTDNLNPEVTYNEIAPDLNPGFQENFSGFFGTILNTVGGSVLEGMAFALPTVSGMGLVSLDLIPIGEANLLDWLGAYMMLGESTGGVSSGGCDSCGGSGCSDCSSCGGGEGGCGGCNDNGDLDLQACLDEQGCAGDPLNPNGTGCGASGSGGGCRLLATQAPDGKWRVVFDPDGMVISKPQARVPVNFPMIIGFLAPIVFLTRRRRTRWER